VRRSQYVSNDFYLDGGLRNVSNCCILGLLMQVLQIAEHKLHRRTSVRFPLHLPVIFYWNDGSGERTAAGFTCDVSLDGALIQGTICPPVGAKVHVEVLIPSPDASGEQLRIQCSGKVTRVNGRNGNSSFGVRGFFDDDHITRQIAMEPED
jgi:hypothetical protein